MCVRVCSYMCVFVQVKIECTLGNIHSTYIFRRLEVPRQVTRLDDVKTGRLLPVSTETSASLSLTTWLRMTTYESRTSSVRLEDNSRVTETVHIYSLLSFVRDRLLAGIRETHLNCKHCWVVFFLSFDGVAQFFQMLISVR